MSQIAGASICRAHALSGSLITANADRDADHPPRGQQQDRHTDQQEHAEMRQHDRDPAAPVAHPHPERDQHQAARRLLQEHRPRPCGGVRCSTISADSPITRAKRGEARSLALPMPKATAPACPSAGAWRARSASRGSRRRAAHRERSDARVEVDSGATSAGCCACTTGLLTSPSRWRGCPDCSCAHAHTSSGGEPRADARVGRQRAPSSVRCSASARIVG